jgi:hypothetical protein
MRSDGRRHVRNATTAVIDTSPFRQPWRPTNSNARRRRRSFGRVLPGAQCGLESVTCLVGWLR